MFKGHCFPKAIDNNVKPELINIDKSGANTAAIKLYNRRNYSNIKIRQCRYLNNIVEQDHRMIKWRTELFERKNLKNKKILGSVPSILRKPKSIMHLI